MTPEKPDTDPRLLASLKSAWLDLAKRTAGDSKRAGAALSELVQRYSDPARHYHNLEHVAEALQVTGWLEHRADDPDAVRLAVWFHDAVYDSAASDNEERSAELADERLRSLGVDPEMVSRVRRLIVATRHRDVPAATRDEEVVVDADLSVLGSAPGRYERYLRGIRAEYSWVPETEYRRRRIAFLRGMLDRGSVYRTEEALERLEAGARDNMTRELEELEGPDPAR